jgi:hypothetical protein
MKSSELKQIIKEELNIILSKNANNYMFFQNLQTIKDAVDNMLSMDPQTVDMILSNDHDWAEDHIATSKDDVEEVYNFLKAQVTLSEKKAVGKQKYIAKQAEPKDEITAADFEALRKKK